MRLSEHNTKRRVKTIAVSALAALWLTACGGGGDDTAAAPAAGGPVAGGPAAPAPGGAPAPAPAPLSWTAVSTLAPTQYHTVASSDAGDVLVAGSIAAAGGQLYVSTDSGATFAQSTAPAGSWISVDMTPTGERIVGVQYGGGMYLSADSGATWTRIDGGTNAPYESVTISEDGTRIVAVIQGGGIIASSNANTATPTFTAATLDGGGALTDSGFRAVDSSADGMMVVAASHNGSLYVSDDGGASFAPVTVTVGGTDVLDGWYRIAMSDDGNRIAVVGNTEYGDGAAPAARSSGLYVGNRDAATGTWTWTRASDVSGEYTGLAMTGNGGVIAASLAATSATAGEAPATGAGQVLVSSDGGASFTAVTAPAGETNWRSIALNSGGTQAFLAAGEFLSTDGQLYLSSGSLTD